MTARLLFGRDVVAFDLDDAALDAVRAKLTAQKPLLRKYWGSATELVSLCITGDVWIPDSWGWVEDPLREQGLPMTSVVPVERANAWADAWQIVRGAENLDCAYAWLNFSLSAEAQFGVQAVTGFSGANPVALAGCTEIGGITVGGADRGVRVLARAGPAASLYRQLDRDQGSGIG